MLIVKNLIKLEVDSLRRAMGTGSNPITAYFLGKFVEFRGNFFLCFFRLLPSLDIL